jgi:hypothetical protein
MRLQIKIFYDFFNYKIIICAKIFIVRNKLLTIFDLTFDSENFSMLESEMSLELIVQIL